MVFGIDDAAAATIAASALKAGSEAMGSASSAKANKKKVKEDKKKRITDHYNEALKRQFDLYKHDRELGGKNTANRAAALRDAAEHFSSSLKGK